MTDSIAGQLHTLHVDAADVPFVELEPGLEYRLLQARPSDGLVATLLRAQPGATSGLHRHCAPVFGFTVSGAWGHDNDCRYGPGTYVYETPGVPHRFINGDQITEALFISFGNVEFLDPDSGDVESELSPEAMIAAYAQLCGALGLQRTHVLS